MPRHAACCGAPEDGPAAGRAGSQSAHLVDGQLLLWRVPASDPEGQLPNRVRLHFSLEAEIKARPDIDGRQPWSSRSLSLLHPTGVRGRCPRCGPGARAVAHCPGLGGPLEQISIPSGKPSGSIPLQDLSVGEGRVWAGRCPFGPPGVPFRPTSPLFFLKGVYRVRPGRAPGPLPRPRALQVPAGGRAAGRAHGPGGGSYWGAAAGPAGLAVLL